jgi:hypothetical protein
VANETRKTGKKGRKIGRDELKCKKYRAEGIREKNKERKARKEAKRQLRFAVRRKAREDAAALELVKK